MYKRATALFQWKNCQFHFTILVHTSLVLILSLFLQRLNVARYRIRCISKANRECVTVPSPIHMNKQKLCEHLWTQMLCLFEQHVSGWLLCWIYTLFFTMIHTFSHIVGGEMCENKSVVHLIELFFGVFFLYFFHRLLLPLRSSFVLPTCNVGFEIVSSKCWVAWMVCWYLYICEPETRHTRQLHDWNPLEFSTNANLALGNALIIIFRFLQKLIYTSSNSLEHHWAWIYSTSLRTISTHFEVDKLLVQRKLFPLNYTYIFWNSTKISTDKCFLYWLNTSTQKKLN